ncbi:peptidoglycan-binding protein [Streptomyces sp. NPDC056600]|uniref:peptidoglycan-binding protein n=1 Tax=Streptomyces sp. NPDC056600 TaxID=3345874 RepID=UPI003680C93B
MTGRGPFGGFGRRKDTSGPGEEPFLEDTAVLATEEPAPAPAAAGDDDPAGGAAPSGAARGRRWLIAVTAGAVALTGTGLGASMLIKSPAQAAAESKAPPADVLTAPAERKVLTTSVILRGTVVAEQSVDVTPSAVGGEDGGGGAPTVTKTPLKAGAKISPGRVLIEVSGRPVIALKGDLPVYRDLKPGSEGADVVQLQKALAGLGHGTSPDPSGTYGSGTKAAVTALYGSLGYDPVPAGGEDDTEVEAAEDQVKSLERAVADAQDALDDAEDAAQAGAGDATAGSGNGSGDADGEGDEASDGTAAQSPAPNAPGASGGGSASGGDAQNGLEGPRKNLARAQEDLAEARTDLAEAQAASGAMLPSSEVVFLKSFPARVASLSASVGTEVSGPVMKVSSGELVVQGYLQAHQQGLVKSGMKTDILSEITGTAAKGTVQSVADSPSAEQAAGTAEQGDQGTQPAGRSGFLMVVRPGKALPGDLAGQDVRLTVQAASTDGPVLSVPVTSVASGTDGRTLVTVVDGTGAQRRVPVRTGASGDGYVQVTPEDKGTLTEGDKVLTGVRRAAGTDAGGAP